jgi:hypothetical protein
MVTGHCFDNPQIIGSFSPIQGWGAVLANTELGITA